MLPVPLVLALLAPGPAAPPPAVAWQVRYGLSAEQFGTLADSLGRRGYRPRCLAAYNQDETNLFGGAWDQSKGGAWAADFGLDTATFARQAQRRKADGYRPTSLAGCNYIGAERLSCLWEQGAGPAWEMVYGKTTDDFRASSADLTARGYRPTCVSIYNAGGANAHAAVWEKRAGPAWQLKYGLTARDLQAALDDLQSRGYRPTSLSGMRGGAVEFFAGTWEQKTGGAWQALYGQTADQFQSSLLSYSARGYRPVWVAGYNTIRGDRFCSIWEQ